MRVVLRGRSAEMTVASRPLRRAVQTGRGGMLLVTGEHGRGSSGAVACGQPQPCPGGAVRRLT